MACETPAQFLDALRSSRLLSADQLDQLIAAASPQGGIDELGEYVRQRGWLTGYQVEQIRDGRPEGLHFGEYPILDKLGDARSGPVYRTYHFGARVPAVLKEIRADWLRPADEPDGYLDRARAAGRLSHPNQVRVLDAGRFAERPYLVLEFFDGADIGWLVAEGGPLPIGLACRFLQQAARALHHAHEQGVFHGEFRPSALLVTPVQPVSGHNGTPDGSYRPAADASAKVLDLGLAPRRPAPGPDADPAALAYLAPERMANPEPDARSEVYSLGAVLYYALSGKPPFGAKEPATLVSQIRYTDPTPLTYHRADVSPELARLVERMLKKDPGARPADAAEVSEALAAFAGPDEPASDQDILGVGPDIPLASETMTPIRGQPPIPEATPEYFSDVEMVDDSQVIEAEPASGTGLEPHTPTAAWVPPMNAHAPHGEPVHESPFALTDQPHHHDPFGLDHDHASGPSETATPRRQAKPEKPGNHMLWIVLGCALHVSAVALFILFWMGVFDRKQEPKTEPRPKKKEQRRAPSWLPDRPGDYAPPARC